MVGRNSAAYSPYVTVASTCIAPQLHAAQYASLLAPYRVLDLGVYLAPSAFEAGFVSAQHDDAAIAETMAAARKAFASLK
jgi:glutamate-1-semialdehyde aminotransferase